MRDSGATALGCGAGAACGSAAEVLLGGVLLHSMNVLITVTLLPSIVSEIGGAGLMSWPTTAFVAASIVAAAGTGIIGGASGPAGRLPAEPALMPAARSPARWRRRSVL